MRLVVGGLAVRPVYPQFRKCRVRRGSYASCQLPTSPALPSGPRTPRLTGGATTIAALEWLPSPRKMTARRAESR